MNLHDPQSPDAAPCQNLSTQLITCVNTFVISYHPDNYHLLISDKDYVLKTAECSVVSGPCGPHFSPLKISKLRLRYYYHITEQIISDHTPSCCRNFFAVSSSSMRYFRIKLAKSPPRQYSITIYTEYSSHLKCHV